MLLKAELHLIDGFNPCFSGCWSSTCIVSWCMCTDKVVSILVLVDVGLRLYFIYFYNGAKV